MALDELADGSVEFPRSVAVDELPRLFSHIAYDRIGIDYELKTSTRIGHNYVPNAARADLIPTMYQASVDGKFARQGIEVAFWLEDDEPVETALCEVPAFGDLTFSTSGNCVQPFSPAQLDIVRKVNESIKDYFVKHPTGA
ncbi:hypothetical protein HY642_06915 [Candidatus Woesearchaeota archaeon]|nr:hypothetical protein [Candidatus Woesearchaeota archaeon]